MKAFSELTEREVLAVAIASEEEDSRIFLVFADDLRERFPASAKVFEGMADEEAEHRRALLGLYEQRFGAMLPPIRREDVRGFHRRRPIWLTRNLPLATIRRQAEEMERQAQAFYSRAAEQATDTGIRRLLGDLAEAEAKHGDVAGALETSALTEQTLRSEDETNQRQFVLRYIQPGLAGLMDGSVSTLAPLFAAAFATHSNHATFAVGLAASLGAGISMAFAEALSDDGTLTGRGAPVVRGAITGIMTAIGGLGHTLPYLVPDRLPNAFTLATALAGIVVFVELWAIAWIQAHYMTTPFWQAALKVVFGGVLVLATGILIGGA